MSDLRQLTYDYLILSFPVQMKIANKLGLSDNEDMVLLKNEQFKQIFSRAKSRNLLSDLAAEINKETK